MGLKPENDKWEETIERIIPTPGVTFEMEGDVEEGGSGGC